MSFTATPTDGSTTPLPMSSVVPDGTNTPVAVEGGPSLSSGGNTLAPVSMYAKAGNIVDLAHGQATMSASVPVALSSDQTPKTTSTATRTNVAAAASDTSLLASNTSRKGAMFFNDSTATLYLAYGSGAASTTSYTVQIAPGGFFELPAEPVFTGAIRGIWSAAAGSVRITELS